MTKFYKILLLILPLLSLKASCQTLGIGDVTSIESKSLTYESNKGKIDQYKQELISIEAACREKIQKLKVELAALYKERDDLIADMKVGAKCSQCGKYKSEFEKEGKSFEQHLGEVKGYAIPATTEELESTRKMFIEKIALKKVQIQNLEKGDNAVNKKLNDINNLEKANENLCKEITNHSKNYETKIYSEAKSKHDNWVNDLMSYATNILIADDKITIYKARIIRHEQEFRKESETIKERVKKENLETQNEKNVKIVANIQHIKDIQNEQFNYISPLELNLNNLKAQKNETEKELIQVNVPDSTKATLTVTLNQLAIQISNLEKNILDYNSNVKSKIISLENECKKLKDEVFQLIANLPKQQETEIAKTKANYDLKKLEANQSVTKSMNDLANAKNLYSEKAGYYKKQNQIYVDQIISESNRMFIAGQKISCPIWNDVRFQVMGNWNKVFPCVNSLTTMAKPFSSNVFNSYCPEKSEASYMASYKSFLIELNAEDKEAVKGNSNVFWFEQISK